MRNAGTNEPSHRDLLLAADGWCWSCDLDYAERCGCVFCAGCSARTDGSELCGKCAKEEW